MTDFTGKNAEALVALGLLFAVIISVDQIAVVLGPLLRQERT